MNPTTNERKGERKMPIKKIKELIERIYTRGVFDGQDMLRGNRDRFFGNTAQRMEYEQEKINEIVEQLLALIVEEQGEAIEEGKQMAFLEMLGTETLLDYTGRATNGKELNENMKVFTRSLIQQHEDAIKKLKALITNDKK